MLSKSSLKDRYLTVRVSSEQLLVIDAKASLSGTTRSDFVLNMINERWANRLAKAHRPYVSIAGSLLEISQKIKSLQSRKIWSDIDQRELDIVVVNLNDALTNLINRIAADQEVDLDDRDEKETFE
jgi:hypothetical protein